MNFHIQTADIFTVFFYLLAFGTGLFKYKLLNFTDKLILSITLIMPVSDILIGFLVEKGQYNLYIINLFYLLRFLLFFLYFHLKAPQKWVRIFSLGLIPVMLTWGLFNYFKLQGINVFNTLTYIPAAILVSLFSYLNLRRVIISDAISRHNFQLWLLVANCLYFLISIPVQGMEPYLVKYNMNIARDLAIVYEGAEYFWAILIFAGFLWKKPSHT